MKLITWCIYILYPIDIYIERGDIMKIKRKSDNIVISNSNFEVYIQKKIYGGYYLKKFVKNSPFEMIEMREIRVDISEDDAIEIAKELLAKVYNSAKDFNNFGILPT
jgi:hypothetical protein